ncbi:restriction endonuclease subunit S [Streptococcus merionis]|uniref:restriction endonuclease subunit S n=1 Tax=Streptococcus merionis TaxID=400065 RepID=UPI003517AF80
MSEVRLGDLIDFKNGKSIQKSEGMIPIYGGNGVLGYTDDFNFSNAVVIGRVGAYCGSIHVSKGECWVSDNAIAAIPKTDINIDYVYYLLKMLNLNSLHIGSSQPLITQSMLSNLTVNFETDFFKQSQIVNILNLIDSKIAINNQINQELEAMAKTLFDYWFVQFDFPDENGQPYKSSGGKMVYNDQLKREIPEGWEVEKLGDFLTIRNGKDHKSLHDGDICVYGSGGLMRTVDTAIYESQSILIPRKGTLNNVMYVNEAFWTVDTMFYSEIKKENSALFVYYSIKDIDFLKLNTGTGVPSMTSSILYSLNIISPDSSLYERFDEVCSVYYKITKKNSEQNQELAQFRDWLLPMLMNGQVKVD